MASGIYVITATYSGERYVGSSVTMENRYSAHRGKWAKYVPHSFDVLEFVDCSEYFDNPCRQTLSTAREKLETLERFWIDYLKPELNHLIVSPDGKSWTSSKEDSHKLDRLVAEQYDDLSRQIGVCEYSVKAKHQTWHNFHDVIREKGFNIRQFVEKIASRELDFYIKS